MAKVYVPSMNRVRSSPPLFCSLIPCAECCLRPVIVSDTVCVPQTTLTPLTSALPTVPLPLTTTQVCAGLVGWLAIETP